MCLNLKEMDARGRCHKSNFLLGTKGQSIAQVGGEQHTTIAGARRDFSDLKTAENMVLVCCLGTCRAPLMTAVPRGAAGAPGKKGLSDSRALALTGAEQNRLRKWRHCMSQGDAIWRLLEVSGIEEVQGSEEGVRVSEAQAALHCGFHCELHSLSLPLSSLVRPGLCLEAMQALGKLPSDQRFCWLSSWGGRHVVRKSDQLFTNIESRTSEAGMEAM